jgi:type II secretory pathway pseudopilin PulG
LKIAKLIIENSRSGFGLIEIIVAVAILTLALFGFLQTGVLALKLLRNEKENLEATLLAQESLEAVRSIRDASWASNIAPLQNGKSYFPVIVNGKWTLAAATQTPISGKYTRFLIFEEVRRGGGDQIVSSGGTVDPNTRKVISRTIWGTKSIELVTYLTNFQEYLRKRQEVLAVAYEDAPTDTNLTDFPSNNAGDGDPAQGFTTLAGAIQVTRIDLYLRRMTGTIPSDIFVEIRKTPTSTPLAASNIITSSTITTTTPSWVEFRFANPVNLSALTKYYIRLRSIPDSTVAGSGSAGTINWLYRQTASSPYSGGEARRYIGRLSNPDDTGQALDQYDFGFRVYDLE